MDFTLDQLLTIIGRLDDSPGFDTPRERFRRLLQQRMTTLDAVRQVIQQCREQTGEQSHRALQDAVALSGRLLGFETAFARYQHDPGVSLVHGTWHSRRRLHATLIICTDQTIDIDLESISRTVAEGEATAPRIGLLVTTSFYAGKDRLEHTLAAGQYPNLRMISLPGLLRLCALVADKQLAHEDVLQLLNPAVTLDARIALLERLATAPSQESAPEAVAAVVAEPDRDDRRYWVNAMRMEPFTPTERIIRSVIATRQILGINPPPGLEDRVRPGDGICVFIAGRGIVAHARILGVLTDGSRMIRDSKQFTHVLRLTAVTVYETPVIPDQELALKLDLALTGDAAAVTTPISPRDFESITAHALPEAG